MLHPAEKYRRRAEGAERFFENARDPKAKGFAQAAAQRWRALVELAQRQETADEQDKARGKGPS